MRSYHKHKGCVGSHKISSNHKDAQARKAHDLEIKIYERNNGISNQAKPVKKVITKKYKKPTKFSKAADKFSEIITGKKLKVIEVPVDENGVMIVDLTKLQRPLFVKMKATNRKTVELKFQSV